MSAFLAANVGTADLVHSPIRPDWILEGDPRARSAALSATSGDGMWVSVWECSAGRFRWEYPHDEVIQILSGCAELTTPEGEVVVLQAGDTANFSLGQVAYWYVPDHVRKLAVGVHVVSLPARLATRLRRRLGPSREAAAGRVPAQRSATADESLPSESLPPARVPAA